ncbi:MAG: 6-phospho-beta-glucosidase [Candidatus Dormiibacterota bacterium]
MSNARPRSDAGAPANRPPRRLKVALLGGGGFRTPMVHAGLLSRQANLPVDELCLFDVEQRRLDRIAPVLAGQAQERAQDRTRERAGGDPIPVRTTTVLADAVEDADLVLCAIRVGGLEGRAADEGAALRLGLLGQETVGAAGILFALRSIPAMCTIAHVVAERAPRAHLLNFTNPAGVVTEALTPILGDRVLGICDSPSALMARVAKALGRAPRRLRFDYAGLNHLGWLLAARDEAGQDLLPALLQDEERLATIEEAQLFGMEWLRTLGVIPNEYLFYYERTAAAIAEMGRSGTRGASLLRAQSAFYAGSEDSPRAALAAWRAARDQRERTYLQEAGEHVHQPAASDEGGYADVALDVAEALHGAAPAVAVLNVPNRGALPFLHDDAVVEVPCLVDRLGARPLLQPPLPAHARARVELLKAIDRLVLQAARDRSPGALLEAFALHPLFGGLDTARELRDLTLHAGKMVPRD